MSTLNSSTEGVVSKDGYLSVSNATLRIAEFPADDAGRAGFDAWAAQGELPEGGVTTIEKVDTGYMSKLTFDTPFFTAGATLDESSSSSSLITHPDGSQDLVGTASHNDAARFDYRASFLPDGSEDVSARTYSFTFTADEASASFLNGDAPGAALKAPAQVSPGQPLTESEAAKLADYTRSVASPDWPDSWQYQLVNDYPTYDPSAPVTRSTADVVGAYARETTTPGDLVEKMATVLITADGRDNHAKTFPGDITVG